MPNENTEPLTPEQQALVTQWMGLVPWVLRRYPGMVSVAIDRVGEDEVSSAAHLGLVLAARGYDPDRIGKNGRKATFKTYAVAAIYSSILRCQQRSSLVSNRHGESKKVHLLDHEGKWHEEAVEKMVDASTNEAVSAHRSELVRAHVNLILRQCDRRHAYILRARKLQGLTLAQVGEKLGVSKERVRQLQRRAMDEFEAVAIRLKHLRDD